MKFRLITLPKEQIDQFQTSHVGSNEKSSIEKRLNTARRIGNEQQTGEGLVHAAIGRSDNVLTSTSTNGKHAVQLQGGTPFSSIIFSAD